MVVVQSRESEASVNPEAGAIRDARLRQGRRRKRVAAALAAVAALGALVAWLAVGPSSKSSATRGAHGRFVGFERARQRARLGGWRIFPALDGGSYGWCVREGGGGGSCATLPTETRLTAKRAISIGATAGMFVSDSHEQQVTAFLTRAVHGVLADGRPTSMITRAQLPYGLRLVQIDLARRSAFGSAMPALLAVGAGGRPLAYLTEESPGFGGQIRWWEKPARGAPGACQIRAHGLPALEPEWGHVAAAVKPYPAKIIGRAFFSCADSEYYLRNWPLKTAILLDAQHPGAAPASIPGMRAIAGSAGLFSAPGDWDGEITAVRQGSAWLVVAGGSGLTQRIGVLRHLTASVSRR